MTIYTAIIGDYDFLKPVQVPQSEQWKFICFTDQPEDSVVFDLVRKQENPLWEIRQIEKDPELSDTKNARRIKILFHEYIEDDVSIWVDGTFFVNCNLSRWTNKRMKDHEFVTVKHPFDDCAYTDAFTCMSLGRGDKWELINQINAYKQEGLPENNGLISSGVLMRRKTKAVIEACELWWDHVKRYSQRDQVAFGYVNWKYPDAHHSIEWNYTTQKEFQHCPHRKKPWAEQKARQLAGL